MITTMFNDYDHYDGKGQRIFRKNKNVNNNILLKTASEGAEQRNVLHCFVGLA